MISRKIAISSVTLGLLLLLTQGRCLASPAQQQGQQQSQQPPPPTPTQNSQSAPAQTSANSPPPANQHKVWNNDDLVLLRTPADNYQLEEEARKAAKAEAAAKLGAQLKSPAEDPMEIKLPTSIEETRLLIKNKEQDISDDQAMLVSLNAELPNAPDERKKAKQKEIEIVAAELDRAQNELKALQDHLVELHKPPARAATAAPPPPPPN